MEAPVIVIRRRQISVLAALACALAAVAGILYWQIEYRSQAQAVTAALPPTPDLSRWPHDFARELAELRKQAVRDKSQRGRLAGEIASLYWANNYKNEAKQAVDLARRLAPEEPKWDYLAATIALDEGNKATATSLLTLTLEKAGNYAPALLHLARLLADQGHFVQAEELLNKRLKLLPNDPHALFALAELDHGRGNDAAAIQKLKAIVERDSKFQEAHLMLADLLEKTGDANGAKLERSTLRGARPTAPATDPWLDQISLQSYDAYRMQAFGALRIDGGKPAEAMPFLQRALALDPGDIDAVELVAKNALALGRPEEAEATLRRGLQISPDNERLTASLIDVLAAEKNTALAAGAIDSLAKVVREKPLVQIAVGKAYLSLGRPRDALEAFQSALRADPVSFEAQANVGRALLKINRQTEARDALRHAHKMRPEDYGVLGLLAALELELRDLDAAWEHAKELLAMDPNQPEARKLVSDIGLQYGNALSQAGKLTEAETAYREALMLNDNSPALHGALGMIYGKRRRFTEAEREFARYVQLAPNEALGYVFLGSVYSSTGRRDEAISIWKKGLAVARQNADMPRANQLDALLKSVE